MITINNLHYGWANNKPVLDIEAWTMNASSCFVYGPSGCGKSSLLNILAGVTAADSGEVSIQAENLSALSARQRDKFRSKNLGVIFQQFNLLPYLSGLENIQLAVELAGGNQSESIEYIHQLLADLKLPESVLTARPMNLSVGQQQRLAIVRALVNRPKWILADEPTSALDSDSRDAFIEVLLQECDRNECRVIFFSHDISLRDKFACSEYLPDLNRVKPELGYVV